MCPDSFSLPVPEHIRSLKPYVPGKPIEALEREYGIRDSIKLASNENPLGPSPLGVAALQAALNGLHRYPDDGGHHLTAALADRWSVDPAAIVLGNGSDEILTLLARAFLRPGDTAVIPRPSFLMYELVVRWAGAECVFVPLKEMTIDPAALLTAIDDRCRLVFLCNPNNPTGTVITREAFETFLQKIPPGVVVVLDEAYGEFVCDPDSPNGVDYIHGDRPVVVLRTFSKAFGLAGLRIGYGLMPPEVAAVLHQVRPPFNVGIPAQVAATAALGDTAFLEKTRQLTRTGLDDLARAMDRLGLRWFPTEANFFLIDVGMSADAVYDWLLAKGVIVRAMTAYGYPNYIRVSIGLPEENMRLIRALEQILPKG